MRLFTVQRSNREHKTQARPRGPRRAFFERISPGGSTLPPVVQAKLRMSAPNDTCEQEADRIADQVIRIPEEVDEIELSSRSGTLQRKCAACETGAATCQKCGMEPLSAPGIQREILSGETPARPDLAASLSTMAGGTPLPGMEQAFFESRFGHDFSHVRIHSDTGSSQLTRSVNARAFTFGRDIVFGAGQYAPGTSAGRHLLAHELTHVIQQENGFRRIQRDEREEGGREDSGESGSPPPPPTVDTNPCGGSSKAQNYTPTDQGISVSLGSNDFGNTSKLAAHFVYGACRSGGSWRFHLDTLRVQIASAVQPAGFRTNINTAADAAVTSSNYRQIMADLSPTRRVRIRVSCAGNSFTDSVNTYSRRDTYWKRQLVVEHEAFHRQNWDDHYRPQLIRAEREIWAHSIPASAARTAADAITRARSTLDAFMISAYQRTCQTYSPQQESRAYDQGRPDYQQLVDDIRARAAQEGW